MENLAQIVEGKCKTAAGDAYINAECIKELRGQTLLDCWSVLNHDRPGAVLRHCGPRDIACENRFSVPLVPEIRMWRKLLPCRNDHIRPDAAAPAPSN